MPVVPHDDDSIVYAHLPGLLPAGQVLALHRSLHLLLCLRCERGEPRLQCIVPLTLEEERTLVPLLQAFPTYAPYALVLKSIENSTIEEAQERLNTAWLQGEAAWAAFLQPMRTVLKGLRVKLHACSVETVAVQRTGYLLKQWKGTP